MGDDMIPVIAWCPYVAVCVRALAFGCWGVCVCVRAVACSPLYETVEMCVRATCVLVHPGTRPHGGCLHGIQPGYKNAHAAPDGCLCARYLYTTPCCLYSRTPAVAYEIHSCVQARFAPDIRGCRAIVLGRGKRRKRREERRTIVLVLTFMRAD